MPGDTTLIVDPTDYDFGNVGIGDSSNLQMSLSCSGLPGDSITVNSIGLPAEFSHTFSLPVVLSGSGNPVNGNIVFSPTSPGSAGGTGAVHSNALENPVQDFTVEGVGASAQLSPASGVFGNVKVGTTSPQILFTVSNISATPFNVTAITTPAPFGPGSTFPTLPATVPANGSIQVGVVYSPTVPGAAGATLTVTTNTTPATLTAPLTGNGVATNQSGYQLPFFAATSGLVTLQPVANSAVEISPTASNGGFSGGQNVVAWPCQQPTENLFEQFLLVPNMNNQNLLVYFPMEATPELRPVTVRKIILTVRPQTAVATVQAFLQGSLVPLEAATVNSGNVTFTIPAAASVPEFSQLMEVEQDVTFTSSLFRLVVFNLSGPMEIVKVKLVGTQPDDVLV